MVIHLTIIYSLVLLTVFQYNISINSAAAIPNNNGQSNNVCKTAACNIIASELLNNMDNTINPCDNFYKFACGGFIKKTSIPDDRNSVQSYIKVEDSIMKQLKSIVDELNSTYDMRLFKHIKNMYNSCMNKDAIKKNGPKFLLEKLKEMGGWPILEGKNWRESDFDWTKSMYKLKNAGFPFNHYMELYVGIDFKNNMKHILMTGQPISDHTYQVFLEENNSTDMTAHHKYMMDIAMMLGANENNTSAQLMEALEFELALADITVEEIKLRNYTMLDNRMTVAELSQHYPSIPWKEYINNILAPHITIDDNEIVIVIVPEYISNLVTLLSTTPKKIQANYLMWKIVEYSIHYLTEDMIMKSVEHQSLHYGAINVKPQWERCVEEIQEFYSTQLLYVIKNFDKTTKKNVVEMVTDIKNQITKIIHEIDWMDDKTRNSALNKAAAMTYYVGYPDQLVNHGILDELYKNLEFSDDNYLENHLKLKHLTVTNQFSELRNPVIRGDWKRYGKEVVTTNGFYYSHENIIFFPAAILQGSFYNKDYPMYINYGAIGSLIGHEITHGFDIIGRQFNEKGNLESWWSQSTDQEYRHKAQCFINQYNNYHVEKVNKKVNGINTQNENIADNGGYKIAHLAYKNWSQTHIKEDILPGLPYNPQQMFWISGANMWCAKYRPTLLKILMESDPHPPAEFRIIGSYSNLPEFAKDFNCPIGSKMNPKDKCTFW